MKNIRFVVSVVCFTVFGTAIAAQEIRLRTENGLVRGVIEGCPPCKTAMSMIANSHNYPTVVALIDQASGARVGSVNSGCHSHDECAAGVEPSLAACFEPGVDVLAHTTMEIQATIGGSTVNMTVEGPTTVRRLGNEPDPGPSGIELDNMELTGQTNRGQRAIVRVGRSFGLPPSLGTVRRGSMQGTDVGEVEAHVNAEFIIAEVPAVPGVSFWGGVIMIGVFLAVSIVVIRRKRVAPA